MRTENCGFCADFYVSDFSTYNFFKDMYTKFVDFSAEWTYQKNIVQKRPKMKMKNHFPNGESLCIIGFTETICTTLATPMGQGMLWRSSFELLSIRCEAAIIYHLEGIAWISDQISY